MIVYHHCFGEPLILSDIISRKCTEKHHLGEGWLHPRHTCFEHTSVRTQWRVGRLPYRQDSTAVYPEREANQGSLVVVLFTYHHERWSNSDAFGGGSPTKKRWWLQELSTSPKTIWESQPLNSKPLTSQIFSKGSSFSAPLEQLGSSKVHGTGLACHASAE